MRLLNRGYRYLLGRCTPVIAAICATSTALASVPDFSAVLGGSGQDYAAAVASDAAGNTYVAGSTTSHDFPVTPGAFQTKPGDPVNAANPLANSRDAFVAKFASNGALIWATYLGGSGDDWATGVGVDAVGNVLVTGWTRSVDFPVFHALQGRLNNSAFPFHYDAFVTKLDPAGASWCIPPTWAARMTTERTAWQWIP